ncbi:hypothetical protein HY837_05075 [archaeon]|nr:hypothetical protein [archaeon]
MDKELKAKCLQPRTITQKPSVSLIQRKEEMSSIAEQHKNSSEYFLKGAEVVLNSETPLLSILLAYFGIEHKANQLLALHGYKVESHICTQLCLSRVLGKKELAKTLSNVFEERQRIGYRLFAKFNEEEKKNAIQFIETQVKPFVKEVNKLIETTS